MVPHIQTRFHVPRPTRHHHISPFVYRTITVYGRTSQSVPLELIWLNGLFPFRSPLLRESQLISFPKGTEMFHFPRSPCNTMYSCCNTYLMVSGFPHSDISGSQDICRLPELFAGYHVFHRLWLPRHPPHALNYLTIQPQTVVYPYKWDKQQIVMISHHAHTVGVS